MTTYQGKIVEVSLEPSKVQVESAVSAGTTVIFVDDVSDLRETGGALSFTNEDDVETIIMYSKIDADEDSVTLSAPLAVGLTEDDDLLVLPAVYEKVATVSTEDFDEGVEVRIPHNMLGSVDTGIREDNDQETVLFRDDGTGEFVVEEIIGRQYRLTQETIEQVPIPNGPDGEAPSFSPTPMVVGGIGSLFVTWEAVPNPSTVSYDVYVSVESPVEIDPQNYIGEFYGTVAVVSALPNGDALVPGAQYNVRMVARDIDGPADPGPGVAATVVEVYPAAEAAYLSGQLSSLSSGLGQVQTDLDANEAAVVTLQGKFPIVSTSITDGAITTPKMTANTINGDRILANSLQAAKIVAGSITTDRMTANTIHGDRITGNTLAAEKIVAGSITTDRMTANTINGDRITAGTLAANKIVAGSITATQIEAGAVTATKLAADAITGKTISGGTIIGTTIKTSQTGPRIELGNTGFDSAQYWYAATNDVNPAYIMASEGSSGYGFVIQGNGSSTSGWGPASLFMVPTMGAAADANGQRAHTAYGRLFVNAYTPMVEMPWIHGGPNGAYGIRYDQSAGYDTSLTDSAADIGFSLVSGWSSVNGAQAVRLYRDAAGRVEMRGAVNRGSKTSDSLLFTLPTAWRPKSTTFVPVRTSTGTATSAQIRIQLDGGVYLTWTGTNPASIGVDCDWSTFF